MKHQSSCRLLCAKEVADALGVSTRTAQRLMRTNDVASFKVGKLLRSHEDAIAEYVARQFDRYRRELRPAA